MFFRRIAQSSTLFFTYQSFLVTEWSRTVPGPGLSNICWAPRAFIREETIKDKFNMGPSYTNSVIERWSTARLDTKTILQINHKYTLIIPHTPYQPHRGVATGGVWGVSPPPPPPPPKKNKKKKKRRNNFIKIAYSGDSMNTPLNQSGFATPLQPHTYPVLHTHSHIQTHTHHIPSTHHTPSTLTCTKHTIHIHIYQTHTPYSKHTHTYQTHTVLQVHTHRTKNINTSL